MKRQRNKGRVTLAAIAAMCAVVALPGQAHAAGTSAYTFDPGAKTVQGAVANADASVLDEGAVYRSTIKPGEKLYYRVKLDARSNAYVSAVAVPAAGGTVAYGDGITVSLRDLDDSRCSSEGADFGSTEFPRPISAYAYRTIDKESPTCQKAGTYDVLIERESKATSSPAPWDLELRFALEPKLKNGGSMPTEAPENWPSASPEAITEAGKKRTGGSGYYEATSLDSGEWKDTIAPGQTRFYQVPVDWGQQIYATAKLSNSPTDSDEFVGNALSLSLDNPAQGHVDGATLSYSGRPASAALDPLPPVAYENRFDFSTDVNAMRFAGWYYLSVSLSPAVAKSYGKDPILLTLSVQVKNKAKTSPYEGDAGIFGVTQKDRDMAKNGQSGPQAEKSDTMRLVAAGGIGAGTVLVLGLGVWTLLARRRPRSADAVPPGGSGQQPPFGGPPPQNW
ncbi:MULTISPECIES: hypothetical protein [unclassified Streptomyces]|uniref:hypothetical protein n=1 Tax=unclassified Streptomyces TaxID=2593676 RepID=UPI00093BD152|nr:hypothetical protein [Streptomyces sp. TSRI0281]OKI32821.1 hypothetical protein A6A29_20400 [Streptomyces sp. TSRI0281]